MTAGTRTVCETLDVMAADVPSYGGIFIVYDVREATSLASSSM